MAKKSQQEEEVLIDVQESISKAEKFFEDNKKSISIVAGAIFVIAAGVLAYLKLYKEPLEKEAQIEIYYAQQLFQKDSLEAAVNGINGHLGFLDIAADYSGTKAGNLANYYAGVSYLNLGEYENAIKLLDEFSTSDPILSAETKGAIGDAFMELEQMEEALEYYAKAVRASENSFVIPFYLQKAGITAELLGDYDDALDYFKEIKAKYANSKQGADIDKYIARIEAKL